MTYVGLLVDSMVWPASGLLVLVKWFGLFQERLGCFYKDTPIDAKSQMSKELCPVMMKELCPVMMKTLLCL